MGRLDGKVAIVTGAARGMGAATASLFVAEGARVLLTDVQREDGERLAAELGAAARFMVHNVADESHWQAASSFALEQFGRVDVLVNNAGVLAAAAIESLALDDIQRVFGVNLIGPLLGMKTVAPLMKAQRSGSIINVSSVDGFRGCNGLGAYSASKWGVRGMSRSVAFELGPHGVRVNTVHPGGIDTPMGNPMGMTPEQMAPSFAGVPLQRIGRPEEVARATLFLASDEASYVTGAELAVDGGWQAGYFQPLLPGAPPPV